MAGGLRVVRRDSWSYKLTRADMEEKEKRAKYGDCSRLFQVPEKRAGFERTADMLAKSGLLDITMKTAELIRSNQQAKNELMQLKAEIDQFVQNVLANPENQPQHLHLARNSFISNPLNMKDVAASPKVSVIKSHSTLQGHSGPT